MAENAYVGQYDLMPTNFIFMAFYFVLSKGAFSSEGPDSAPLSALCSFDGGTLNVD